jgi:hypothetical protein
LPWNQWQDSPGIGGSFAVEYAGEPSCITVGEFKSAEMSVSPMPALKAKKHRKLAQEKVLLES